MICELCGVTKQQWRLGDFLRVTAPQPQPICTDCKAKFTALQGARCPGCDCQSRGRCGDCDRWQDDFKSRSLYQYDDQMKAYFRLYKFNGGYHLRHAFTAELAELIRRQNADMVVPIPVSATTLNSRGFNQVKGLLEFIEYHEILTCIAEVKDVQSIKTRAERLKTAQPFRIKSSQIDLTDKKICLVDDIYTTGRTLRHAAKCLYDAGAKHVCAVTLSR